MTQTAHTVKVWDWPVRLCHWSFAVLVPAMWYTGENSLWAWHTRIGVALFGLLIFRIIWGVIGTDTARFANFVRGPRAVFAYLRGGDGTGDGTSDGEDAELRIKPPTTIGHSPLGALSVIALLLVMSIQVGMGLFAGDPYDGATGPLNALVSVGTADMLTDWHEIFYYAILGMVGIHLTAIAYYTAVKLNNLVSPMVTGSREVAASVEGIGSGWQAKAFAAAGFSTAVALWVGSGAPPFS